MIVTVDPHDLVSAATGRAVELPEREVHAGLPLRDFDHGMVVPCRVAWAAVGCAGDGQIDVAVLICCSASCEGAGATPELAQIEAMYRTFVSDDGSLFEDVPLPGLEPREVQA